MTNELVVGSHAKHTSKLDGVVHYGVVEKLNSVNCSITIVVQNGLRITSDSEEFTPVELLKE